MNIIVPVQLVPDLVEELSIDPSGKALDSAYIRWILNEFDDHSIEQAILIKEAIGASVTIVAPDLEGVDDVFFTAAAKGADRFYKVVADFESNLNSHSLAKAYQEIISGLAADLVLTGVQTHANLDGSLGPILAEMLGIPYVGYVSSIKVNEKTATVHKEYAGGLIAKMEIDLPAVLGVQAAEKPPRYVPVSKVRQVMKTTQVEAIDCALDPAVGLEITRMYIPEPAEKAEMIAGPVEVIADKMVSVLSEHGLV